jgi:hypothetical protein
MKYLKNSLHGEMGIRVNFTLSLFWGALTIPAPQSMNIWIAKNVYRSRIWSYYVKTLLL